MLEAIELTKKCGTQVALDRLNLTIAPGEVFCLLGANGAGKTTTINLFLNFINPSGGSARINGLDVSKQPLDTSASRPAPGPRVSRSSSCSRSGSPTAWSRRASSPMWRRGCITPSAVEFQNAMDAELNKPGEMERRLDQRKVELMRQFKVDSVDALSVAFSGVSLQ